MGPRGFKAQQDHLVIRDQWVLWGLKVKRVPKALEESKGQQDHLVKWDLRGVRDPKEPREPRVSREARLCRKTGNSAHGRTSMMAGTMD